MTPQTISARVGTQAYSITVGLDVRKELVAAVREAGVSRLALITDDRVEEVWGKEVLSILSETGMRVDVQTFPSGERSKNQQTASELQDELLRKRLGRDSLIVALGGGVVGDMAGYVAATYLRGVPYIQMPTTILAMVDSSIGGKVGVDTEYGKNTIGAFWQPRAVLSDLRFLKSLDRVQVVSGLLEAVKSFLTVDKGALELVNDLSLEDPLSNADVLQQIIARAVSFKAGVVERDEREENERRILNFGHTVGHAIELLSHYEMPHGFTVGLGILVETKIAEDLGILPSGERELISHYLVRFGIQEKNLKDFSVEKVLEAMRGDKKTRAGAIYLVLLEKIGAVYKKDGQFAHAVEEDVIRKAYESLTI